MTGNRRIRLGATLKHRADGREFHALVSSPDGSIAVLDQAAKVIRTLRPTTGRGIEQVFEVYMQMGGDPWL